uniref:Uncharacterized protein n=1 Tax=Anguilla anguilla TaxID=7936 RepID=A0A0E9X2G3_ANGAN
MQACVRAHCPSQRYRICCVNLHLTDCFKGGFRPGINTRKQLWVKNCVNPQFEAVHVMWLSQYGMIERKWNHEECLQK